MAIEQIIVYFHSQIYALILLRVNDRDDALDISQDVFMKAWKKIQHLETPSKFKSWLYAIAYNKIKDFNRRKKILTFWGLAKDYEYLNSESDKTGPSPPGASFSEFREKLEKLLTHMTTIEKEIFLMKFIDELTIAEIAEYLNRSQSTVKTHLYRGLKKFKQNGNKLNVLLEK